MVVVPPSNSPESGVLCHDLHASSAATGKLYSVSHFDHFHPASRAAHSCDLQPSQTSPNLNETGQPGSSFMDSIPSAATALYSFPHPPPPRSESSTPLYCPHPPHISGSGMIVVLDYTPSEGEANIPITVNVELRPGAADNEATLGYNMSLTSMKLRLVFGRTAVKTTVNRAVSTLGYDGEEVYDHTNVTRLRLHANAPAHAEVRFPSQFCVPLSIQAMDEATKVIETFTFGSFTYWTPSTVRPAATIDIYQFPNVTVPTQNKRKREREDSERYQPGTFSISPPVFGSPKKAFTVPTRVDRGFKLVRTSNLSADVVNSVEVHSAELEWMVGDKVHHPNQLDKRWSAHEMELGRRLIRFEREQHGNKLLVSCEIIPQEAYDEDDIVISCVYRQDTHNCWFTSVDIIYLLERLVGNPFSVEEKNRIRRNLEGLKPTTVSKSKGGFETFFQRIMDFPPPKPRNIEKDVKVFPWSSLDQALDKIISKYSVIPRTASDSSESRESSSLSSTVQVIHTVKASRGRSSSSVVHLQEEGQGLVEPLKPASSQHSLHLVVESPPMLHSDPLGTIPEPEAMPVSMGQFNNYPHAQDIPFHDADHWRRRQSIISLATTSSHTDEYFSDQGGHDPQATPGPLHVNAFSNPFASDVNLGSMSIGVNVDSLDNGPRGIVDQAHATLGFETGFADDMYASRRSSLAETNELMYPMPSSPHGSNNDMMATSYDTGMHGSQNSHHDILYY